MQTRAAYSAIQHRPVDAPVALGGIRVVDFSHFLAGPQCTQTLGDLGAEVIKIEPPDGDSQRRQTPRIGEDGVAFHWANRNKQSLVLDLAVEDARATVRALLEKSDVLVENFSTGVMQKFGLDYETVRSINPSLIYCSISAGGRTGALAKRTGFDAVAQAESGLMATNGFADREGVQIGTPVVDITTGMTATIAILAALVARASTGRGQYIDVSMLDQAMLLSSYRAMSYLASGQEPGRTGNMHQSVVPVGSYKTGTGPIYLCCANERTYQRLAKDVLNSAELSTAAAYADNKSRVENIGEFNALLESILLTDTRDNWLRKMRAEGVPAGPVASIAEAFAGDILKVNGQLTAIEHSSGELVPNIGLPVKFSVTPVVDAKAAPMLGADSAGVLRRVLGYSEAYLDALRRTGALGSRAG